MRQESKTLSGYAVLSYTGYTGWWVDSTGDEVITPGLERAHVGSYLFILFVAAGHGQVQGSYPGSPRGKTIVFQWFSLKRWSKSDRKLLLYETDVCVTIFQMFFFFLFQLGQGFYSPRETSRSNETKGIERSGSKW